MKTFAYDHNFTVPTLKEFFLENHGNRVPGYSVIIDYLNYSAQYHLIVATDREGGYDCYAATATARGKLIAVHPSRTEINTLLKGNPFIELYGSDLDGNPLRLSLREGCFDMDWIQVDVVPLAPLDAVLERYRPAFP